MRRVTHSQHYLSGHQCRQNGHMLQRWFRLFERHWLRPAAKSKDADFQCQVLISTSQYPALWQRHCSLR
jgi:hypothetical protein